MNKEKNKYAVEVTPDNQQQLLDFLNNGCGKGSYDYENLSSRIVHFPAFITNDYGDFQNGYHAYNMLKEGYTLVSTKKFFENAGVEYNNSVKYDIW